MIQYKDALMLIREAAVARGHLSDECVTLDQARGRVCASQIVSETSIPPFSNSAMDGFAVLSETTAGACREQPVRLLVKGVIAAGDAPLATTGGANRGNTWEIMTGAPMPAEFDAVAPIHDF